ncbi:hypothetical protein R1flu_015016 [Riccia fluitans]|uniref:Uncharacterized protein n=1 Tax=Riccia fluitans TaxID=41844 RepID=A0ABD1YI47_9MARC
MTSSTTETLMAECTVCLEPYDHELNIPRVLSCGHSFCDPCLHELHTQWHTSTSKIGDSDRISGGVLRCPECNQGTKLPLGGLKLLPKNVALLRLLPTSSSDCPPSRKAIRNSQTQSSRKSHGGENRVDLSSQNFKKKSTGDRQLKFKWDPVNSPSTARILHNSVFSPSVRQDSGAWDVRAWILPQEVILMKDNYSSDYGGLLSFGEIVLEQGWNRSRISVSLLRLEVKRREHRRATGDEERKCLEAECSKNREKSYEQVLLEVADGLDCRTKLEISVLLRISSICHRVCKTFGLWMNQKLELFLVCEHHESAERLSRDVLKSWSTRPPSSRCGSGGSSRTESPSDDSSEWRGKPKMEVLVDVMILLCELLLEVHAQGLVLGLLHPKSIVFDEFGNLLLDTNTALGERNSFLQMTKANKSFKTSFRLAGQVVVENDGSYSDREERGVAEPLNSVNCQDLDSESNTQRTIRRERKCWEYMCPEVLVLLDRDQGFLGGSSSQYAADDEFLRSIDREARITCRADVWSLGLIIAELVTGKLPLKGSDLNEVLEHIRIHNDEQDGAIFCLHCLPYWHQRLDPCPYMLEPEYSFLGHFLQRCFTYDPKKRADVYEVLQVFKELKYDNLAYHTLAGKYKSENLGQKNWILCLPGFVAEGLVEYEKGKLAQEQELDYAQETRKHNSEAPPLEVSAEADALLAGDEEEERLSEPFMELERSLEGHLDYVTALIISGIYLLSASFDKTIRVWSLEGNQLLKTLKGHHTQVILALAVDVNSMRCFSGDQSGLMCVWQLAEDMATPFRASWREHSDWRYTGVASLAVSEDGILYSGSGDRSIKAWSCQSFERLCTMEGHKAIVSALIVNGEILYSGSWDGVIRVWWRNDHSLLAVLSTSDFSMLGVRSICLSDNMLFAGHDNGSIRVWKDDEHLSTVRGHSTVVASLCVEGPFLYSGSWDDSIKVWRIEDITSNSSPALEEKCGSGVAALASDGSNLYVAVLNQIKVYSIFPGNSPLSSSSDAEDEEVDETH